MYQDIFEPFARSFHLSSDDFFPTQKWENALLYFMTIVTELTAKEEGGIIGHIKMVAELDENSFIKLNAVRSDLPVEIKRFGNAKGAPSTQISFNSLVYHISEKRNAEIISLAVSRTLNAFSLHTDFSDCSVHSHQHDQHNHENEEHSQ